MELIKHVIEEIKELEREPTHKSALRIYSLLENNKKLFLEKIEEDDFNHLLSGFEAIADKNSKEYNTPQYVDDFKKNHRSLSFYLNRII